MAGGSQGRITTMDTMEAFDRKWEEFNPSGEALETFHKYAEQQYLINYGFGNEKEFAEYLSDKQRILDAGCGLGHKAAFFARLSPNSQVVGVDYALSSLRKASMIDEYTNLTFLREDISSMSFSDETFDYVSCDQVIHHTPDPAKTLSELRRVTVPSGEIALYVYRKKALPRELLDDHFRNVDLTHEEYMELSSQLTKLGKILSDLDIEIDVPDIPLLGIRGGKQDIQRFIYWNFLKCYWNNTLGYDTSVITNYDWYSPEHAYRYSIDEFVKMTQDCNLETLSFYYDEASICGRFRKI